MSIREQWLSELVEYLRDRHRLATDKQLELWAHVLLDSELSLMDDYLSL